jgi:DNA-3-methyladenine glycosylase II
VRAIAYQQLTAKARDAMIDRLKDLAGSVFPTPPDRRLWSWGAARFWLLRREGRDYPGDRTGALGGVVPTRAATDQMDDEALITRLVSIKGVGRWKVEMLLMYSLERMDVLPANDFGVRESYRVLKSLSEQPKPTALREFAQMWSPHRTVAARYLWRIPRSRGRAPA